MNKKEQDKDSSSNKERRIRTNDSDVSSNCSSTNYSAKPTYNNPSKYTPKSCTHNWCLYSTWDGKDNLYKEDREEEASLILVLQECAGDVDIMDITKLTVAPIHGNSHMGVKGGELAAAYPRSITGPSKPLGRSKSRILGFPRKS